MCAVNATADTTAPMSWGWIAVAYGLEYGVWLHPGEAAVAARTDTASLRRWALLGYVTCIHWAPGQHRRYLQDEMEIIALYTSRAAPVSTALVKKIIFDALCGKLI